MARAETLDKRAGDGDRQALTRPGPTLSDSGPGLRRPMDSAEAHGLPPAEPEVSPGRDTSSHQGRGQALAAMTGGTPFTVPAGRGAGRSREVADAHRADADSPGPAIA